VSAADPRRALPAVDAVVAEALATLPDAGEGLRPLLTALARRRLEAVRGMLEGGAAAAAVVSALSVADLAGAIAAEAAALLAGTLRPVINATGVILQTNLGRAPLSDLALARVAAVAGGFSSLELDLDRGRRGDRAGSLSATFEALVGVPAVVVNNNAASLLLLLAALAKGREVIVSRGELIEIGGSFRLPDVMRASGARLVEVGTTNRTRVDDYAEAIGPRTAMLLKVHTSNYRVVGFTDAAPLGGLAALARERGVLAVEDLGSGALLDTAAAGLAPEPTVGAALAAGADLVCFSGDKLLGGPQAGILAGRADLVARLGRHPLYRALRPDKLTLAALEATLGAYLRGTAATELPVWRMILAPVEETRRRAAAWAAALPAPAGDRAARAPGTSTGAARAEVVEAEVVEVESTVGGGALPGETLGGFGLAVRAGSATRLAARLRAGDPPVVARIAAGRVIFDPRTVLPEQDEALLAALRRALPGA
jgi:L-seryl-tRNA(Ser) seleniumtransferase